MRNADYWRGRFSILEDSAHREAQRTIQDMENCIWMPSVQFRRKLKAGMPVLR